MSGQASVLVVPGEPSPTPPANGHWPSLPLAVIAGLGVGAVWWVCRGRRRRAVDPRELVFRRIVHTCGFSRSQVRALRRAAAAQRLASPVGIALSPTLTARAMAEHGPGRTRS